MSAAIETPALAAPVIKFVGGKRQLLPEILPRLPLQIRTYYEPFVGGGAVFFALANEGRFKRAVIGDSNELLVNMYTQLRDKCSAVIDHLRTHAQKHCEEYYYEQRSRPQSGPSGAARFIYLNRTGFNGLYRVNKSGENNVPFGRYENPKICDMPGLRAASAALQGVTIRHGDFAPLVSRAAVGDAAYMDPPYLPVPGSASFTAYGSDGFSVADHERLADCVAGCVKRGANALLSNSDTPEARRIFTRGGWHVEKISAHRNINSDGEGRGVVGELLVSAPKRKKNVVK
jgi:DNA adenine methylase